MSSTCRNAKKAAAASVKKIDRAISVGETSASVKIGPMIGTPRFSNIQKKKFIEAHHGAATVSRDARHRSVEISR
jgi:hypothetical protein